MLSFTWVEFIVLRFLIRNVIKTFLFDVYRFCIDVYYLRICDGVGI